VKLTGQSVLTVVACVLFACVAGNVIASAQGATPNIVILYADDLGFGDLGSYNAQSKIPTPALDKLADEGMRFTDAHSSSGICSPSRYALLTGRYHWRKFHGIVKAFGPSKFDPERLTLPEMLQREGYKTAVIGKWHLGWDWNAVRKPGSPADGTGPDDFDWERGIPDGPLDHGFDYYFGDNVINFPPYTWIENNRVVTVPDTVVNSKLWSVKEGKLHFRPGPMVTGWNPYENIPTTTQKGIDYIKEHAGGGQPFFLYFSYPSPHAPIIPNERFVNTSEAGPYGDYVVETDDSVGKILQALDDAGVSDSTLVIFSADNGPENYAYDRDANYGHWSSHPLRGLKRDIYEGGHRVPMIVRWPEKVPAGTTSDELVSQIDIMATLAELLEHELPDDSAEDSHNLLPLWTGETVTSPRTVHIHNTGAGKYAIRHSDWTLIANKTGYRIKDIHKEWEVRHGYRDDTNAAGQLFDMQNDIGQRHNLIEQYPEKAAELAKLLQQIQEQGYSAPRLGRQ
jgi:arylsulfatase A